MTEDTEVFKVMPTLIGILSNPELQMTMEIVGDGSVIYRPINRFYPYNIQVWPDGSIKGWK